MSIAVIIVNYGTADLAIEAVASVLERSHSERQVEVHLVDNASPGGDAEALARAHAERGWGDRVTLWPEGDNHGFGRGNNVVLEALATREAPPAFVFLLNPDARLENGALAILADALDAAPGAAAAGAGISLPDGGAVTSAFRFPGPASLLLQVIDFGPLDRLFSGALVPLPPDCPEGPVGWVSGAAVMFRFQALRQVGFFDPDFFLYFEETELQHRLTRAGWQVLFIPRARVVHAEGAATGQFGAGADQGRQPDYLYRSRWMYLARTRGRFVALTAAFLAVPAALLNILQRRLRGRKPTLAKRFFTDHWRHGILPLLRAASAP